MAERRSEGRRMPPDDFLGARAAQLTGKVGENVWAVCRARNNITDGLNTLKIKHAPSGTFFECEGCFWEGPPALGDLRLFGWGHLDWNDPTAYPAIQEKPRKSYPATECILQENWPKAPSKYKLLRKPNPQVVRVPPQNQEKPHEPKP